jgi:uncharacterized LabA/DUF88 family protein
MTRVAVFVDYQNTYRRARDSFGDHRLDPFNVGQVHPGRLASLLTTKGRRVDPKRRLDEVRVYRGEPDARHDALAEAACKRQVEYWRSQAGVSAVTRPLHYQPIKWRAGRPAAWEAREKGIDVRIALDMAMGAVRDTYDVAVLVSADTDLVPALEVVLEVGKRVEVASWRPDRGHGSRLELPGRNLWCHWLDRRDFEDVSDATDYTKPSTG